MYNDSVPRDVNVLVEAFSSLPAKKQDALRDTFPELHTALTNLIDARKHQEWLAESTHLKMLHLSETGSHVPGWMTNSSSLRV